jgi:hypothetical protein
MVDSLTKDNTIKYSLEWSYFHWYIRSKENIMDSLTKYLTRELMYSSSRKYLKMKECYDDNYT